MKLFLSFLAFVIVTSCSSQSTPSANRDPFDSDNIKDIQPVSDPSDLKQLIKSLPVWDCPPPQCPVEEIDGWISRMGKLKGNTLFIAGDGAQIQLRITKLPIKDQYELEVGSKDLPEGGHSLYKLKRLESSWQVISR